jgi:proprotein convertase subtilisin/kexin type 5
MKMIRNSRFVYYVIEHKETQGLKYRGIVDIELNQIIFNTNEDIREFKPLGNNSMLAITSDSAYQICPIKENNKCVDRCSNNKTLIIDYEKGNYCSDNQICEHYKLIPDNTCIESCDDNIYASNENKECGYCINLFKDTTPYKIINKSGCLNDKPKNTYYIDEKLKLLNYCEPLCLNCSSLDICYECQDGYDLEDQKCKEKIKCHPNCRSCINYSDKDEEQNCTACNEDKYLQIDKGNCVDKCLENYYLNETNCLQCHKNCKECLQGPENDEKGEINENCESCESNLYIIKAKGFNKNCVSECPIGTTTK